jgi:hypothetical protein
MAELKARDLDAEIIRNGSRGLYWLEPMVEVETEVGPGGLWSGQTIRCRRPS